MGCCQNGKTKQIKLQNRIQKLRIKPGAFIQEKSIDFYAEYSLEEKLGSGAFSTVHKCKELSTGDIRVVKIVSKESLSKRQISKDNKLKEMEVIKLLDHPNIIKIFKGFEDEKNYYIVMEFCAGGELFQTLVNKTVFTEVEVARIMSQLFSAVAYFHSEGVVHRDLKPENIFIEGNVEDLVIKVGDFGNSTLYNVNSAISGIFGSLYYMAPEVINQNYDEKCDEWSCGIIMFMLLTGRPPFTGNCERQIIKSIRCGMLMTEGPGLPKISRESKDLMHRLIDINRNTRITASKALSHPWIKIYEKKDSLSSESISAIFNNLKRFRSTVKLKGAIYSYIASQRLSQIDTKDIKRLFKETDVDGDGRVSKEELLAVYNKHFEDKNAEEVVGGIMQNVDVDKNGLIEYTEFVQASVNKDVIFSQKNLVNAFKEFDRDGNGGITASEIAEILKEGETRDKAIWQEMIRQVDDNGDHQIDVKEFQKMLLGSNQN